MWLAGYLQLAEQSRQVLSSDADTRRRFPPFTEYVHCKKHTEITFSPQHDEYSEHAYFKPLPAIATGCSTRTDGLLIFPQICIRRNFNRVLFWGGQRLNCKDSESLSLLISLPCCPYDQELWVTTNRMRCQPSHRNKMFTWQVSGNCTFNLYMLYVSYPHFYKLCHITRRLQVFELIFMSEGEGGMLVTWRLDVTPNKQQTAV